MALLRTLATAFILVLALADAHAQLAGRVQFVSGTATIERAAERLAVKIGDEVRRGDALVTAADGLVQLVMVDQARVSMRPASRMRIDEYRFDENAPGAGEALLYLATGAIRTFTGKIVAERKDRFRMKTTIATVGIRGSGNILAHFDETGTLNHTLTGVHSVTAVVDGIDRTLLSYPGQTIQVRPGLPPRYVPTPPAILAAAAPVSRASGGGSSSADSTSATSTAAASTTTSTTATASGASTPSGSDAGGSSTSSTPSTATSASPSTAASAPPANVATDGAAATAVTSPAPAVSSASGAAAGTSLTGPATSGSTASSSSQAAAATVGAQIVTIQNNLYDAAVRFYSPVPGGGYEGVLGTTSAQDGGSVVLDDANRLTRMNGAVLGTYISGPGSAPPGYSEATYTGAATFSGGQHADGFRASDGSVIIGRWVGGSVTVDDGAGTRRVFDLGPRSAPYVITAYTPAATLGAFTGTAVYTLAASTAPTDAAGNAGTLTSASISANFGSRTIAGNLGLTLNGASYVLAGNGVLVPGDAHFAFASSLGNLTVGCSGTCGSTSYLGTVNGAFSGPTAQWIGINYRINADRGAGGAYNDFIVGAAALNSANAPTVKPMPLIAVATPGRLEARRKP